MILRAGDELKTLITATGIDEKALARLAGVEERHLRATTGGRVMLSIADLVRCRDILRTELARTTQSESNAGGRE